MKRKEVEHYWMSWCLPKATMLCRLRGGSASTHIKSRLKEVSCKNCLKKYTYKPLETK